MDTQYSPAYFSRLRAGASNSAKVVVPIVTGLIRPTSVIDLGCGIGSWLAEFKRRGVEEVFGIDGSYIPTDQLEIDKSEFAAADLLRPLRLRSHYDLALSLEVAEHLSAEQADVFIENLTRLSPVVLFSAAVPHQGGEQHVNEQWPTYWVERFDAHNYIALDPFRRVLWERTDVEWWYAQNLALYIRRDHVTKFPWISETVERGVPTLIHPLNYLQQTWQNRVLHATIDIATVTRPGDTIVVADEDRFGTLYLPGRFALPIIERKGAYFGPPADDVEAVSEVVRMAEEGANYLAIGWPAFWWLEHYHRLTEFLNERCVNVLHNENVIIYRLGA